MSLIQEHELTSSQSEEPAETVARSAQRESPLRRWARRAVIGDALAAAVASFAALLIRFGLDASNQSTVAYGSVGVLTTVAWPVLLGISGAYELKPSLFGVEEVRRILRAALLLLACAGMAHIIFRLNLSRGYFLALLPLTVALTTVARTSVKALMGRTSEDSRNHHRVVAVGPSVDIAQFCADIERTGTSSQVEIVGYVADDLDANDPDPRGLSHLHRLADRNAIGNVAGEDIGVDLLVRAGRPGPDEMWALGQRAHNLGATVAIAPHRHDATATVAVSYVPLGSTPLLMVETPTLRPSAAIAKGVFDRVIALLLLIALWPLLVLIAATIAVRDGRPVLFRQTRVGRYGTEFECLKFRTMCNGAEEQLEGLQQHNEADGPLFKVKDDPRVTTTGRFLRRHSLDELPQFLHVLTGDMSIVGPRPPLPSEVESYDARTSRRLNVKPGITGLWQTQGRSNLPWDDGIYLDLMYIDHWSPLLDLVIMARTIRTVLRPDGAY